MPGAPARPLLDFLSKTLPTVDLKEAHSRALAITFEESRGQVMEFLEESERARRGSEDAWDEMRLRAAALIEAITALRGRE